MITLTREEAQQVLDALQCATPPTFSTKLVEDWEKAIAILRARLSAPEPVQVSPKEFIAAVTGKWDIQGIPRVMSVWPTKEDA